MIEIHEIDIRFLKNSNSLCECDTLYNYNIYFTILLTTIQIKCIATNAITVLYYIRECIKNNITDKLLDLLIFYSLFQCRLTEQGMDLLGVRGIFFVGSGKG